jgi:hypothetical protein
MSSLLDYYWNQLGNRVGRGRGGPVNTPSAHTHSHRLALLRSWFLKHIYAKTTLCSGLLFSLSLPLGFSGGGGGGGPFVKILG